MVFNPKKLLIATAIVIGALVSYALAGFYLLPRLALNKLPEVVKQQTGQIAQIEDIRLNPFTFVIELDRFSLQAADGKPFVGFERLAVDLDLLESARLGGPVLDSILLTKPQVNAERRADGAINFSDIKPQQASQEPETPDNGDSSLGLKVHRLSIADGQIAWRDASAGNAAKESLLPVNLIVEELSTLADAAAANATLSFGLESGGSIEWHGELTVSPLSSKGQLKLERINLVKVWQLFLQQSLPLEIAGGQASLQADYLLSDGQTGISALVSNGGLQLDKLEVAEKNQGKALVSLPSLQVGGIGVDLARQQISIASVASRDATINAWLQADGIVNYQALFAGSVDEATTSATAPDPARAEAAKSWLIKLDELALNNYQIKFTDFSLKKPVELKLSEMSCKLQRFNSQEYGQLPMEFSARFNQAGRLKLDGDITLEPFAAAWAVDIKDINLKIFQPYVDPFVKLELVDGDFNGSGKLQLAVADPLQLTFQGDANLDGLITRDQIKNKDFVKWANLALVGVDIDLAKQDFKLGRVVLDRPYLKFNIKKDGSTNIDDILVPQKPEPAQKTVATNKAAPAKSAQPSFSIGKVELKEGKSDFADYSLILPFVAEMNNLNGDVSGFSTDKDAEAKLALKGKVYDMATVGIKGKYQFETGDSDITLNFNHMPLPLVTPYMAEFAGYKIEKGQMALDLQYKIKRNQLEVQNKLFIDQLTLGEQVENPHAVSLPLHLAIALLKDGDGKINLDFPISGSLEDPKFSVGSLIADVLVNLITKVATSPFKAIASLLGDDQDFSTISFTPGSAELAVAESSKLDQLNKALDSKPELTLEIKGMAYQHLDWPAMRFEAVKDVLKKMKSGELRDQGQKVRHEYIELSDDDYKRLLAKFFAEVFPQDFERSLLGTPRVKSEPNGDFYALARQKLEGIFPPDAQRLNDLAVARANHIAQYMTERGGLSKDRVYLLATELSQNETADGITSVLSLNAAP